MAWAETDRDDALMVISNTITGNTTDVTTHSYKGVVVQIRVVEVGSSSTTDIALVDGNGVDLLNGDAGAAFTNISASFDYFQDDLANGTFCSGTLTSTTTGFTGTSLTLHVYILRMR